MIRTKNRLGLCIALLTLNLAFIWGNSLLPGEISGALSDWVKDILAMLFGGTPGGSTGGGLLRKLAHFTEFACLGMCLGWLFGMLRTKRWEQTVFALMAGCLAASIDETIQLFVPLRGPSIRDVGIDTLGVILGISILILPHILKTKHMEETKL